MATKGATGYLVHCDDGPAEGFEYTIFVEPSHVIYVGKLTGQEDWSHVLADWPDAHRYRFAAMNGVNDDGDIVLGYTHEPH